MSKLKEILDGWGNRVKDEFGMLDIETKKLAAQRLAICDSCYVRNGNSCSTKLEGYNAELGKIALKKIEDVRFSKSESAPPEQFGDITFVFKSRAHK